MLRDYLKIIRWPNLVVMVLVQILMYECVLKAILSRYNQVPALNWLDMMYLIIATVFIAAGGYLVNDYFDMKIDEINKPITRVVGKSILRKDVMFLYCYSYRFGGRVYFELSRKVNHLCNLFCIFGWFVVVFFILIQKNGCCREFDVWSNNGFGSFFYCPIQQSNVRC